MDRLPVAVNLHVGCCVLAINATAMQRRLDHSYGNGKAMDSERTRSSCSVIPSNTSVKIGGLWKRSQGLSRFTRPNYKHRVFILTEQSLSYYCGTVDVSLHELLGVLAERRLRS